MSEKNLTPEALSKYDGSGESGEIYVAIRGVIYDVTPKKDMYGPGGNYRVFAGKDASKALAKSSLKPEDCVPDVSDLNEEEVKTLDNWVEFFGKRYTKVGTVIEA
ncbi:MAG: cytochrome b5-like heme/steroid binding domain-containing protein [Benniella sp.]|nr:MAG: cytochrome b5-like heme/steroid binding domain-containing protein [Benniella sp.]